jgi:hypothetical protein
VLRYVTLVDWWLCSGCEEEICPYLTVSADAACLEPLRDGLGSSLGAAVASWQRHLRSWCFDFQSRRSGQVEGQSRRIVRELVLTAFGELGLARGGIRRDKQPSENGNREMRTSGGVRAIGGGGGDRALAATATPAQRR